MGDTDTGWVPPQRFDEFAVVRPLGRGGMGHVYLARDLGLDRPVALKFIAGDPSESSRRRFLTEARALARLAHPNVVGVFRIGELQDRPYIAYEFVPGRTLDQVERPLPWPMGLRIAVGLALGLAEAHRAGVLHRDLKPSNAVLSDGGVVKLLDFGLARLQGEIGTGTDPHLVKLVPGAEGSIRVTRGGKMMGTPAYFAPELWLGEPASQRSDLYSLGLVLYELLAGKSPHPALADVQELARTVLARENPPLCSVRAEVPESLGRVIDRCLKREPEERYPTAEALVRALQDVQAVFLPLSGAEGPASLERDAIAAADSFAKVVPEIDRFTSEVYARLFAGHPELRVLFPEGLDAQRTKLAHALRLAVEGLHQPERLVPALEDLGRRHREFKVPAEGYEVFTRAMIDTLKEFQRAEWTHSLEQVWTRAVSFITASMQRGQGLAASTARSGPTPRSDELVMPGTRWTESSGASVAYQVFGRGKHDIVMAFGWLTHVEMAWRHPSLANFLRRLGRLGRVLFFDKRGVGLSDRGVVPATPEEQVADVLAVMNAAGSERAVIFGVTQGVACCAAAAAMHPGRVAGLLLYGGAARTLQGAGYPFGISAAELEARVETIRARWGEPLFVEANAPSMKADLSFRAWWAEALRMATSPGHAVAALKAVAEMDLRPLLPRIAAPTLVLHRRDDRVTTLAEARFLADLVPGARLVELPGEDHLPYVGDSEALFAEIERFLATL